MTVHYFNLYTTNDPKKNDPKKEEDKPTEKDDTLNLGDLHDIGTNPIKALIINNLFEEGK